jgi:hypothetical protein
VCYNLVVKVLQSRTQKYQRNNLKEIVMAMKQEIHKVGTSPDNRVLTEDAQKVQGSTPSNRSRLMGANRRDARGNPIVSGAKDAVSMVKGAGRALVSPGTSRVVGGGAAAAKRAQTGRRAKRAFESGAATKDMKGFAVPSEVDLRTEAEKKTVTPWEALEKKGQSKLMQERLGTAGRFKPGDKVSFEGGGSFAIAGQPRAQEGRLGKGGANFGGQRGGAKKPSVFSQKGMESFFGNMGSLAETILSPEYQKQVRDERNAATSRAGRLADTKARTDKMKAYASMIKDISEADPDSPAIPTLQEQLQKMTSGDAEADIDPLARIVNNLADLGLPREMLTQIYSIIESRKGANQ